MSEKPRSEPVHRNDLRYAHQFLKSHRRLCMLLFFFFSLMGFALAGDWLGHSVANPHWQVKNWLGAAIAWCAALIMAFYAMFSGKRA